MLVQKAAKGPLRWFSSTHSPILQKNDEKEKKHAVSQSLNQKIN